MSDIRVDVQLDERQINLINKLFYGVPKASQTIFYRSIQRGVTAADTEGKAQVRARHTISYANVQKYSSIRKNTVKWGNSGVEGDIDYSGSKIPLYKFIVSPAARNYTGGYVSNVVNKGWRRTSSGIQAMDTKATGMHSAGSTSFIAKMENGHVGLFKRVKKTPGGGHPDDWIYEKNGNKWVLKSGISRKGEIKQEYGPAMADMLDWPEAREKITERATEMTMKRMDHEILNMLNGF